MDKLAAYSGGERRNKPISKIKLGGSEQGSRPRWMSGALWRTWVLCGWKLESEAEAAGFMEDRVDEYLDRLVDKMLS